MAAKTAGGSVTTAAVVALARQLRERAAKIENPDPQNPHHVPDMKPYAPSDDVARKCVSECKKTLVAIAVGKLDRPPTGAELEEIESEAARKAPAAALAELRYRADRRESDFARELEADRRRKKRQANRQQRALREKDAVRRGFTLGQRLDAALGGLACVANGHTQQFGTERVTTGKASHGDGLDLHVDDPTRDATRLATEAVRQVEDMLETARRRRIELEQVA